VSGGSRPGPGRDRAQVVEQPLRGGRPERADQSVTKKLKLRAERKGDAGGKPLGC
jgi:hypothetical protein